MAASRSAFKWTLFSSSFRSISRIPSAQHFAGVLIATGGDQLLDEFRLLIRENDITCRHDLRAP